MPPNQINFIQVASASVSGSLPCVSHTMWGIDMVEGDN